MARATHAALGAVLRLPLYRQATLLVLNTVMVSAGGLLFWWLAARVSAPGQVGLAAAMISSMTFLVTLANLGMGAGLIRFLPSQADGGVSLIESMAAAVVLVAVAASGIFVVGLGLWAPALAGLRGTAGGLAVFVAGTTLAAAATLLDSALVGTRAAQYVVAKNGVALLGRIVFVPVLAAFGALGLFTAVALGFAAAFATAYFLLLPRVVGARLCLARIRGTALAQALPYSASNLLSDLVVIAPSVYLPLLVLHRAGAEATGYFYVAWQAAGALSIVPAAFALSLFTEGAHAESTMPVHLRRAVVGTAAPLGLAVAVVWGAGGWVLALFGRAYAEGGTVLLRMFALATVPAAACYLAYSVLRVRHLMAWVVGGQATLALLVLVAAWSLTARLGLAGVGWAWLAANTIVAGVVTPVAFRQSRAPAATSAVRHPADRGQR
jgi:O-antigen/teichoic acid export membrane protein